MAEPFPTDPNEVMRLVHEELHRLARHKLAGEPAKWMFQSSSLVQELYIKLFGNGTPDWKNRGHFFGIAAEAMRRIIVARVKKYRAERRQNVDTIEAIEFHDVGGARMSELNILALDNALTSLEKLDERKADVVKFRFFSGMTIEQTSLALDLGERTIGREWNAARAFLQREIERMSPESLN